MPITPLAASPVLAYHGTETGSGNPMILVIFLGLVATVGWVLFSKLSWRNTMMVTGAGWLVLLAVTFVL